VKTALILGVSGQDGSLLAKLLLDKGYHVVGSSREPTELRLGNLSALQIRERVDIRQADLVSVTGVAALLDDVRPDEVYGLAGQSSVSRSFDEPEETFRGVASLTTAVLEALRLVRSPASFVNAASGDCFGDIGAGCANESTPLRPVSPYAVAKASAAMATRVYREGYGLRASSAYLFSHESPLRPAHFVTRKVISAACRIAAGSKERLTLGNVSVQRDWGWAPEYVEAVWRMAQRDDADDLVIATGEAHSLQQFVDAAFEAVGLEAARHVDFDRSLTRRADISRSCGDASLAARRIGWSAHTRMRQVIAGMVAAERGRPGYDPP